MSGFLMKEGCYYVAKMRFPSYPLCFTLFAGKIHWHFGKTTAGREIHPEAGRPTMAGKRLPHDQRG